MKKLIICMILLGFVVAPAFLVPKRVDAEQKSVIFPMFDDTYAVSNEDYQHGTRTKMSFGYSSLTQQQQWMYLKFSFNIPANATIDLAHIKISSSSCSGNPNPTTFTIAQVRENWTEGGLVWSNRPSVGSPMVSANTSCGYGNFDVKPIVESWKNGAPNYGLALYGPKNGNWFREFYTREAAGSEKQPSLIVIYTIPNTSAEPAPDPANDNSGSGGNTSGGGTTGTGITNTQAPTSTSNTPQAPTDTSVNAPTFDRVVGGGESLPVEGGVVDVSYNKMVTVIGKSTPGYKVLMSLDGKTYEATVNSLGYWGVTVESEKFKEGNYLVTAQAINPAGKGSQIVNIVTLKKVDLNKLAKELSAGAGLNWEDRFGVIIFYAWPILTFLFWVVLIIVIIVLVRKRKQKKEEQNNLAPVSPEVENQVTPSEAQNEPDIDEKVKKENAVVTVKKQTKSKKPKESN